MQHRQVVLNLLLPANEKSPEAIEPRMGPLHYPASRPVAGDCPLGFGLFAPRPDMRGIAPRRHQFPNLRIIVTPIQADMLQLLRGGFGALHHHRLQRGLRQLHVVPIGPCYRHRKRNAVALGQQAAFGAALGALGRIRTSCFSPLRCRRWHNSIRQFAADSVAFYSSSWSVRE